MSSRSALSNDLDGSRSLRGRARTFFSAPQSVASLVAAFLEPGLAVAFYLGIAQNLRGFLSQADLVLCLLVFALGFPGLNRFRDGRLNAAVDILIDWASLLAILAICGYVTRSVDAFPVELLAIWAIGTPLLQWGAVLVGRALVASAAALPSAQRRAVVVGAGPLGAKVAVALEQAAADGVRFDGFFDDRGIDRLDPGCAGEHRGPLSRLADYVRRQGVREVYVALPLGAQPRFVRLLEQLQGTTASIYFVPDVFGIPIIQGRLRDLNGVPVVALCETPFTGTNRLAKRISDLVLASVILLVAAPLMAAIAIGVKVGSPGPVIFRQRRNGLDGEEIVIYKFRTMRTLEDGAVVRQATRGDPRVTPFGAFLRRTSLDELPQFVNVLQGRMSVVGPRPHAVAHNDQYREIISAYMVRHKVKPGITGWAQIHGFRGETDTVEKMRSRVEHDLEYLRRWSLALDLRIIAHTLKLIVADRGAY